MDLNNYWQEVDLLIRPTLFDGTAFMIIEAMLNNVKVLCSDLPDRPSGVYKIPKDCNSISYVLLEEILKDKESTESKQRLSKLLPPISALFDRL